MLAAVQKHPVLGFQQAVSATTPLPLSVATPREAGDWPAKSPRAYGLIAASASKVAELMELEAEQKGGEETKPAWERLPSGTKLRVWWDGSDDYFTCKILDWRVAHGDNGGLVYTHRCQ